MTVLSLQSFFNFFKKEVFAFRWLGYWDIRLRSVVGSISSGAPIISLSVHAPQHMCAAGGGDGMVKTSASILCLALIRLTLVFLNSDF